MESMKCLLTGTAAVVLLAFSGQGALAKSGTTFIKDAIQGDNAEIKMGQLAQQNASSQGVKDFGKTLETDHRQAKTEAEGVAQQLGVTPPSDVKPDAQTTYDQLSKMSGASFDKAFVQHMVADHKKDIAEFRKEANAKSGPASNLAAEQLPTLEKHLQIAEKLQNGSQTSGNPTMSP